jgi:hypothetical protein
MRNSTNRIYELHMALFLKFKLQYPFKYENGTETPEREEQWISYIRNSHTGFRTHSFSTSKFKYEKRESLSIRQNPFPNASHLSPAKTPLPAKKGKISFVFVDRRIENSRSIPPPNNNNIPLQRYFLKVHSILLETTNTASAPSCMHASKIQIQIKHTHSSSLEREITIH